MMTPETKTVVVGLRAAVQVMCHLKRALVIRVPAGLTDRDLERYADALAEFVGPTEHDVHVATPTSLQAPPPGFDVQPRPEAQAFIRRHLPSAAGGFDPPPQPRPADAGAGGDGFQQAHGQRLRRRDSAHAPGEDQAGRRRAISPQRQGRPQMLDGDMLAPVQQGVQQGQTHHLGPGLLRAGHPVAGAFQVGVHALPQGFRLRRAPHFAHGLRRGDGLGNQRGEVVQHGDVAAARQVLLRPHQTPKEAAKRAVWGRHASCARAVEVTCRGSRPRCASGP
jgi:hypothetical protein